MSYAIIKTGGKQFAVESGQKLPDDILVGISTPANAALIRPGTSWFGHPSFELPRREVVAMTIPSASR